jgi:hypothetical protein
MERKPYFVDHKRPRGNVDKAGLMFCVYPSTQNLLTAMSARLTFWPDRAKQPEQHTIAVTMAPAGLDEVMKMNQGVSHQRSDDPAAAIMTERFLMRYADDPSVIGGGNVDVTIYVEPHAFNGATIAQAIREAGYPKIPGFYPNTGAAGIEPIIASTAEHLRPDYNIRITPSKVSELLGNKQAFNKYQKTRFGYRVPDESKKPLETNDEILRDIDKISYHGKRKVIIKGAKDIYGSISYFEIGPKDFDRREEIVNRHKKERDGAGASASTVQEYMKGTNMGAFITVSGGNINIMYTQKTMSKGPEGNRSEEVGHAHNPKDPAIKLCENFFTEKLEAIVRDLGLDKCNGVYNADLILNKKNIDDSYIDEINDRLGTNGAPEMFTYVLKEPYYAKLLHASMGDSGAVEDMNEWKKHKDEHNAAKRGLVWPNYTGPLLEPPYVGHAYGMDSVFYLSSMRELALLDGGERAINIRLQQIEHDDNKGGRPTIGVYGRSIRDVNRDMHHATASLGMLGLWDGGLVVFDGRKLEYRKIQPNSRVGKHLKDSYGCIWEKPKVGERGIWSRPENEAA